MAIFWLQFLFSILFNHHTFSGGLIMNINKSYHRFILPVFITLFAVWSIFVYARSGGITGRTQLSSTPGCTCHNANPSGQVSVILDGPTQLTANSFGVYTVTISGGPLGAAGVNVAASSGSLKPLGSDLKQESSELTHTSPKQPASGSVVFEFEYTAPATPGLVSLAATGNSVNRDQTSSGDAWNHANNLQINILEPSSVNDEIFAIPAAFQLGQNYPNPFNPSTSIQYSLDNAGQVSLDVYNLIGQKVATLVEGFQSVGIHRVTFNANNLESGYYIYRLTLNGKTESKRMLLLK